jgi:hypothetical protein
MPKSVVVFGRTIPIKYLSKEEIAAVYASSGGSGSPIGLWDSSTRTIYLCKDYPESEQLYTLLHEMGHAAKTFTGLELILPAEIQELVVQTFATLGEDLLRQAAKFKGLKYG